MKVAGIEQIRRFCLDRRYRAALLRKLFGIESIYGRAYGFGGIMFHTLFLTLVLLVPVGLLRDFFQRSGYEGDGLNHLLLLIILALYIFLPFIIGAVVFFLMSSDSNGGNDNTTENGDSSQAGAFARNSARRVDIRALQAQIVVWSSNNSNRLPPPSEFRSIWDSLELNYDGWDSGNLTYQNYTGERAPELTPDQLAVYTAAACRSDSTPQTSAEDLLEEGSRISAVVVYALEGDEEASYQILRCSEII